MFRGVLMNKYFLVVLMAVSGSGLIVTSDTLRQKIDDFYMPQMVKDQDIHIISRDDKGCVTFIQLISNSEHRLVLNSLTLEEKRALIQKMQSEGIYQPGRLVETAFGDKPSS